LNKYLYSGKRGIKVNIQVNSSSEISLKNNTANIGELITAECASVREKSLFPWKVNKILVWCLRGLRLFTASMT
jgi:hypothetical protein